MTDQGTAGDSSEDEAEDGDAGNPAVSAAIEARNLSKIYRLYNRPKDRLLDLVGYRRATRVVSEHRALDGVTLSVRRGEKVGLIGRNGAGKSTFLKLVSGVIEPSSGVLNVAGSARALLEIGTGFHLDFTGRENVRAYLAQMALPETEMRELMPSIVDFAEVEEYIDQPLKTYSTGMRARLMFATSTAVSPELLILDEVLGVGDAYFTRKSFDRIAEMCQEGTTLLLVSHDMYAVSRIADRLVWLEKGRVVFDGKPSDAVAAYEASIRDQEEERLRNKAMLATHSSRIPVGAVNDAVYLELGVKDGAPGPIYLARVALVDGDQILSELDISAEPDESGAAGSRVILPESCWGQVTAWKGEQARPLAGFGSPFRNGGLVLTGEGLVRRLESSNVDLVVAHGADPPAELVVNGYIRGRHQFRVEMSPRAGWLIDRGPIDLGPPTPDQATRVRGVGTGRIEIRSARVLGPDGQEARLLQHGRPITVELKARINGNDVDEKCDLLVSFLRSGVDTVTRVFTRDLRFEEVQGRNVTIRLRIPRLQLGSGDYTVAVQICENGYFDRQDQKFYSVEPGVYYSQRDLYMFSVTNRGVLNLGTGTLEEGDWSIDHSISL
ncbi:MAG: ABC transporter ATP-binding protein [Acidimicrobiales bacterium]